MLTARHGKRFLSLCLQPASHALNWHHPLLNEKIYSSSSGPEQAVFNGIWTCSYFIRLVNFLGDRLVHEVFLRGIWPWRVLPRHSCAAPTCWSRSLHTCMSDEQSIWKKIFLDFFLHITGLRFLHTQQHYFFSLIKNHPLAPSIQGEYDLFFWLVLQGKQTELLVLPTRSPTLWTW